MSDSFVREVAIAPEAIGDNEIILFDPGPDNEINPRAIHANIQVRMSDGSVRVRRVNLQPYLSAQMLNGLISFVEFVRTEANDRILPET